MSCIRCIPNCNCTAADLPCIDCIGNSHCWNIVCIRNFADLPQGAQAPGPHSGSNFGDWADFPSKILTRIGGCTDCIRFDMCSDFGLLVSPNYLEGWVSARLGSKDHILT